jgi:hypothetical protein
MSKNGTAKRSAGNAIQSMKQTIQALARQLWVEERDTMEGVEWLVDGRLMAQLDELSKSDLLRIQRLLEKQVGGMASGKRYMTAGSSAFRD